MAGYLLDRPRIYSVNCLNIGISFLFSFTKFLKDRDFKIKKRGKEKEGKIERGREKKQEKYPDMSFIM